MVALPRSGSARRYYRFFFNNGETLIGSYNPEIKENIAHYSFTQHFKKLGLPVPQIFEKDESYQYFILEDLGDTTLLMLKEKKGLDAVLDFYLQALNDLLRFQIEGIQGLDLSKAHPAKQFNRRSILWDLNYFKYSFVKTNDIFFDENALEDEFESFTSLLLQADSSFFMYRDFQSRNIMVTKNRNRYIDFQGGRKGPLQYDVISLLYQAKAQLPEQTKKLLLNHYLHKLDEKLPGQKAKFLEHYPLFIYFRLMQVLGAYGFRGLFQHKPHFLQSIPYTIQNLRHVLKQYPFPEQFKTIRSIFQQIEQLKNYDLPDKSQGKLVVSISSFSFKKTGYPFDASEHGGGFVFDCRALPNPGRLQELKDFTGLDEPVVQYLETKEPVQSFLDHVYALTENSINNYLERNFDYLSVNFGCTGGQHRSVYCAEKLKGHLQKKYGDDLKIHLKHIELEKRSDSI